MTKNGNIFYYFIFLLMNIFRFFRKKSKLVSNETWISVCIMNISNLWGDLGAKCVLCIMQSFCCHKSDRTWRFVFCPRRCFNQFFEWWAHYSYHEGNTMGDFHWSRENWTLIFPYRALEHGSYRSLNVRHTLAFCNLSRTKIFMQLRSLFSSFKITTSVKNKETCPQ